MNKVIQWFNGKKTLLSAAGLFITGVLYLYHYLTGNQALAFGSMFTATGLASLRVALMEILAFVKAMQAFLNVSDWNQLPDAPTIQAPAVIPVEPAQPTPAQQRAAEIDATIAQLQAEKNSLPQ